VSRDVLCWSKAVVLGVENDRLVSSEGGSVEENGVPEERSGVSNSRDAVRGQ
jgi:hypothetical protein